MKSTVATRGQLAARGEGRTPVLLLLLTPNFAFAKGGGGMVLLVVIFFPILIWALFKIWTYWFRLIFGGREHASAVFASKSQAPAADQRTPEPLLQETKECPFCAEHVLAKAKKCKHCGSAIS